MYVKFWTSSITLLWVPLNILNYCQTDDYSLDPLTILISIRVTQLISPPPILSHLDLTTKRSSTIKPFTVPFTPQSKNFNTTHSINSFLPDNSRFTEPFDMPGAVPKMPGVKAPPEMCAQFRREVARLINRGENISFPGSIPSQRCQISQKRLTDYWRCTASQFCATSLGGAQKRRVTRPIQWIADIALY